MALEQLTNTRAFITSTFIFIFFISQLLIIPSITIAEDPPDDLGTRGTRANTLPIPKLNLSHTELLTLETLTIDASNSYDPDGSIAGYFFQFEDGTESGWITTPVIEHVYLKERFYNIRLKVIDDSGEESNYWEKITVNVVNRVPFIVMETELTVDRDKPIQLEGYQSWDEDGYIINYTWEFEDNTTLYGANVSHTFTDPGIYNIFLTVLDDDRKTNKSSVRVIVPDDESVSRSRTLVGLAAVIIIAAIGSLIILFGRGAIPVPGNAHNTYLLGKKKLDSSEAEYLQDIIKTWLDKHGSNIPPIKNIDLPYFSESYIFALLESELNRDRVREPGEIAKLMNSASDKNSGKKQITPHAQILLELALIDLIDIGKDKKVIINRSLAIYSNTMTGIIKHEQLGEARYYIPRTNEQEVLAAFITRKVMLRRIVSGKAGTELSDEDKTYIHALVDLTARCWKASHSFSARVLSDETKLFLTLALCEKTGKRRFGHGRVEDYEPYMDDEELDFIEELIQMYTDITSVLAFKEYRDRPEGARTVLAFYLFEMLGARRYLGVVSGPGSSAAGSIASPGKKSKGAVTN